jgi:hypothetical protein
MISLLCIQCRGQPIHRAISQRRTASFRLTLRHVSAAARFPVVSTGPSLAVIDSHSAGSPYSSSGPSSRCSSVAPVVVSVMVRIMTQRGCVPFASSACAHIPSSDPHNSTNGIVHFINYLPSTAVTRHATPLKRLTPRAALSLHGPAVAHDQRLVAWEVNGGRACRVCVFQSMTTMFGPCPNSNNRPTVDDSFRLRKHSCRMRRLFVDFSRRNIASTRH